ncbi:MAG: exodeoxyribonuclease VII large subunit [Firmicutes bacterium]|nr:exodeoxyribonuclease VII large subunit [Bacillota bacterium]MCM1400994.1 exodeoxyribonuclease VII large subunit [Bacteroides sp.]MCM1476519.1 exodeoxyribonuclease VII large subunit [Bacteroides sp.]
MNRKAVSLSQLNRAIAGFLSQPSLTNVWVVAELMDVRLSRGHCYMELVEKQPDTRTVTARLRAAIWASNYGRIAANFHAATGRQLSSGVKVMLCGTVGYHPAYGLSLVVSDIDPSYTMGEAERKRREILERLTREGIINDNRMLPWPDVALRVAVISAPGAAGYGDFMNQLYSNPLSLRFVTRLFEAQMQGERTVPTVIAALDSIAAQADNWDCVVIIRGGGASSELQAFDDYQLALNVAQFPLPVIVGIGHERDVTVLDYVGNMRVKTPTAAAEWLIAHGEEALGRLRDISQQIYRTVTERTAGARTQLAQLDSMLSVAPEGAVSRADGRLRQATAILAGTGLRRIVPELTRLDHIHQAIATALANTLGRRSDRLDATARLLEALSPRATLKRGFSLTLYRGKAVRNSSELPAGADIETYLANGHITSTVKDLSNTK